MLGLFSIWSVFATSFLGLLFAIFLTFQILRAKEGSPLVREIGQAIRQGAMAFMKRQYRALGLFILLVAVVLWLFIGDKVAISFVFGALFSGLAGNIGMRVATYANSRTAWASKTSLYQGLRLAFSSGSVMGLSVVCLGLLGIGILYIIFKQPQIIYGFGLGASSIALFARVGGGIYTKAADVGADLVGKIEAGIPEDDPRNPAVIADNVGDNVGDVAGMGADLFESYVDSLIAAMVLGVGVTALSGGDAVLLPLFLAALGILASLLGNIPIQLSKKGKPEAILDRGIFSAALLMALGSFFLVRILSPAQGINLFWAVLSGLVAGIVIGLATQYYTASSQRPARQVAQASQTGAATNIITGFSLGMESTLLPIVAVCSAILVSFKFAGIYGIALSAVGMLSTLGITLAADTYGPVADNAAGIAEMAGLGKRVRSRTEKLDAVGNSTAAMGKGFAIGSAALTAVVLAVSYGKIVGLSVINLLAPQVVVGLFVGGLLPFIFSSLTMRAVGRAAFSVIKEVRRQFQEISGLLSGRAKPDYNSCIGIVADAALSEMFLPGVMAVVVPVIVGFGLGKTALGGLLFGAIITGFLLAVTFANTGGLWDNAKKYIEAGKLGGKGSDSHKAAVVGDTIGDPFKDTSGPSLNILIKLMSIVALIIAPLL